MLAQATSLLSALAWLWLLVAAHEAGHFFVAHFLDRPLASLTIGDGPVLRQWYWRGINCQAKLLPFSGAVRLVVNSRRKWVNLSIYFAGCAVNLALAAVFGTLGLRDAANLSLLLALYNLLPYEGLDGHLIWQELRRHRPARHVL